MRAIDEIDDETRRRVQEMLVLIVRMSRIFDGPFERAGLSELSSNRSVQVLMHLHRNGASRPRDLQGPTGLTSGGLTKLIDRLVSAGVVERFDRGGVGDGRSVLVRLTRSGHAAARRMIGALADVHDDCRPLAKELMQLAEAAGARTVDEVPDFGDVAAVLSRAGVILVSSISGGDEASVIDAVHALIALGYVDLHPQSRPGALVDVLGLSSGGVSKLLDRLEAQGLIGRQYGVLEFDRRAVVLQVTEAGYALLRAQTRRVLPHIDEVWVMGHALAEGRSSLA